MAFGDYIQDKPAEGGAGFDASLDAIYDTQPVEGNLLVAVVCQHAATGTFSGVQDGDANAFTEAVFNNGGSPGAGAIYFRIAGASQHQTITMTPASSALLSMVIAEIEGPWESSPLDKTASALESSGATSLTSGTTAATAQADEVAVAGWVVGPSSAHGLSNSFTLDEVVTHTASASDRPFAVLGHKVLTATGTQESTLSWTTTAEAVGLIATFKKAATESPNVLIAQSILLGSQGYI